MSGDAGTKRPCPTCSRPWTAEAFYDNCAECKACKRDRSKRNRALQARKIAAFERFVDVLVDLASQSRHEARAIGAYVTETEVAS